MQFSIALSSNFSSRTYHLVLFSVVLLPSCMLDITLSLFTAEFNVSTVVWFTKLGGVSYIFVKNLLNCLVKHILDNYLFTLAESRSLSIAADSSSPISFSNSSSLEEFWPRLILLRRRFCSGVPWRMMSMSSSELK